MKRPLFLLSILVFGCTGCGTTSTKSPEHRRGEIPIEHDETTHNFHGETEVYFGAGKR